MPHDIKHSAAGAVIRDIAEHSIRESQRKSIFQEEVVQDTGEMTPPGVTTGGARQASLTVGSGSGGDRNAPVLTTIPDAFNPDDLTNLPAGDQDYGTPTMPRCGVASPRYISGIENDTMAVYLQWAPPLVDTANRWLVVKHVDQNSGVTTTEDLVGTYLIQRTNQESGETVTVGAVSHNEQYISLARDYIKTHNLCTEANDIVTFDPSILVDGKVQLPPGVENYFTFTDLTAQYGKNYRYFIQAISLIQEESESLEVIPQSPTGEGTLEVQVGGTWVTSYPDLTSSGGTLSFADFAVICSGMTTDVEIGIVPIQPNAIPVDTTPDPETDPVIVSMNPSETVLLRPTTGSRDQIIEFRGRNLEICGGITAIAFGTGAAMKTPLSSHIIKTRVGTTDEWDYQIRLAMDSTAVLGPMTMTVTCQNGRTATCSTLRIEAFDSASNEGATFDSTRLYDVSLSAEVIITGKNMDRINALEIREYSNNNLVTTVSTFVVKESNYLEFQATLPGYRAYKVIAKYVAPFGSTGKDTAMLLIRHTRDDDGDNGSRNSDTGGAGIPTNSWRGE